MTYNKELAVLTYLYYLYRGYKNTTTTNSYRYTNTLTKDTLLTSIINCSLAKSSYNTPTRASRIRLTIVITTTSSISDNPITTTIYSII